MIALVGTVFARELVKLSAVSDTEARRALDRLDALERTKPSAGQVGRYAAIGAVAGPAIGALANIVGKGRGAAFTGSTTGAKLRDGASMAVKGGLGASVIPLSRTHFDRRAEMGTLKKYVAEQPKLAFSTSAYSGPLGPSFLRMESDVPSFSAHALPSAPRSSAFAGRGVGGPGSPTRGGFLLASPTPLGKQAAATTPAGRLEESQRVGAPRATAPPGPSIATIAKPIGFGRKLPGALKGTI